MKNKKAFILPVILLVLVLLISCSTKETSIFENITISTDSHPEFVLKSSKNMSEKQISKDERIKDALNKAITDYPELSSMLEADIIDGGSNNYIYEGSEPFFKSLQTKTTKKQNQCSQTSQKMNSITTQLLDMESPIKKRQISNLIFLV